MKLDAVLHGGLPSATITEVCKYVNASWPTVSLLPSLVPRPTVSGHFDFVFFVVVSRFVVCIILKLGTSQRMSLATARQRIFFTFYRFMLNTNAIKLIIHTVQCKDGCNFQPCT